MAAGSFNLDAWIAEQEGKPFEFEFGGEHYQCPYGIDIRVLLLAQRGKPGDLETAIQHMLGAAQYNRLITANAHLPAPALQKLVEQYALQSGMDLGESLASSDSSPKKATRSRPTSAGSTKSTSAA